MMLDRSIFVYGLKDPRTGEIRYIGKSTTGMRRPLDHTKPSYLAKDDTHKGRWLKQLVSSGLFPEVVILAKCSDKTEVLKLEVECIAKYRAMGVPLTNLTDGGDGLSGHKFSEKHKSLIAVGRTGKTHSPETKAHLSKVKGGLPPKQQLEVRDRYISGESSVELSVAFATNTTNIQRILKRHKVKLRPLSKILVDADGRIYQSTYDAAIKLNCSPPTISRMVTGKVPNRFGLLRQTAAQDLSEDDVG